MKSPAKLILFSIVTLLFLLVQTPVAYSAGPYTDSLVSCIGNHLSGADRAMLGQWMFATVALNPQVEPMSAVSHDQRDALNQQFASLLQTLLTESCLNEARDAVTNEGNVALRKGGLDVLFEVAWTELFAHPAIGYSLPGIMELLDEDAFAGFSNRIDTKNVWFD